MENTINDRVEKIIRELFSSNKRAFSRAIDVAPTVTENIVGKRRSRPSYELISKMISSIENLNVEWLITGNGKMIVEKPVVSDAQPIYGKEIARPFFDATNISLNEPDAFSIAIKDNSCRKVTIPFMGDYDFSLRVHGDSMVNSANPRKSINDQDVVICKLWNGQSHIRWGEVYAIVTSGGCIVKKVMPSKTEGNIECISLNEDNYMPYDLPLTEIYDWAIVTGVISVSIW
ncbi:hypothetical protein M2451_003914 [Dysgonomonas sp. PFB1-18]|uniref:S24 family peptidase n=1 Tax=unclassified Dysgonomonas TaxID=2630389 RepID=UPI002475451E|nr:MULTISPECIES: S24 family peptidase [unclassified Dysgonomonas]MDH6311025.1 hypothetical protein [Dysgonomonas sp. PF1-14]MDH6337874.1 hypothetical protein [Dysgonomonas sp. PF1-16]MDH6382573.1 hypothetical protein [Dysgonomonas sp. PFB1-18]MDH6398006.1 hypothetical protein [Dysgonomonas sp. PF1-23]